MIDLLNTVVEDIESRLAAEDGDPDLAGCARTAGVTEYHVRRMFSSLAGMPVSEYIRRRRMTVAAADLIRGADVLTTAVRYGYSSAEAFGRAFRGVHGASPTQVRADGGPLHTQPQLRFRLTVEGSTPMDARIVHRPTLYLTGRSVRVPLIYDGVNPHIAEFVASIPAEESARLVSLSNMGDAGPAGILAVTDSDPEAVEGSELTYLHGVAVAAGESEDEVPGTGEFDVLEVPAGDWVVFRSEGPHPQALQSMWAATATDWFPSNPWQLRTGPSVLSIVDHDAEFTTATCELWMPVAPVA